MVRVTAGASEFLLSGERLDRQGRSHGLRNDAIEGPCGKRAERPKDLTAIRLGT
jgi:hypothetical protein